MVVGKGSLVTVEVTVVVLLIKALQLAAEEKEIGRIISIVSDSVFLVPFNPNTLPFKNKVMHYTSLLIFAVCVSLRFSSHVNTEFSPRSEKPADLYSFEHMWIVNGLGFYGLPECGFPNQIALSSAVSADKPGQLSRFDNAMDSTIPQTVSVVSPWGQVSKAYICMTRRDFKQFKRDSTPTLFAQNKIINTGLHVVHFPIAVRMHFSLDEKG